VSTGFVVDDAIVVLENISRTWRRACAHAGALVGAREVGFTVMSMSFSLIACSCHPADGRHRRPAVREFAMTLSLRSWSRCHIAHHHAMMCALFLRPPVRHEGPKRRTLFDRSLALYERTLGWSLRHSGLWCCAFRHDRLNVALFVICRRVLPTQDTADDGRITADQSVSFQAMEQKLRN